MARRVLAMICLGIVCWPIASAAAVPPGNAPSAADTTEDASASVREALLNLGLTDDEAEERLEQMTVEDLRYFAEHTEQIQSAGDVPDYIWILLGVLLGLLILSAVF